MHGSGFKFSIDVPSVFSVSRSFKVSFPSDDHLLGLINFRTENILSSFPLETGNENSNRLRANTLDQFEQLGEWKNLHHTA